MKWTLNDYISKLRQRIDEIDEELFTNEELTGYINEAIQIMGQDLQNQSIATYTLDKTKSIDFRDIFVSTEDLATEIEIREHNFLQLKAAFLNNQKLELRDMDTVEGEFGRENQFYIWGETINLKQPAIGELKIYYIKKPSTLVSATDTADIPPQYQHIALEYGVARAKQKDGDYGLYDYSLKQFYNELAEMKYKIDRGDNYTGVSFINITDYGE